METKINHSDPSPAGLEIRKWTFHKDSLSEFSNWSLLSGGQKHCYGMQHLQCFNMLKIWFILVWTVQSQVRSSIIIVQRPILALNKVKQDLLTENLSRVLVTPFHKCKSRKESLKHIFYYCSVRHCHSAKKKKKFKKRVCLSPIKNVKFPSLEVFKKIIWKMTKKEYNL